MYNVYNVVYLDGSHHGYRRAGRNGENLRRDLQTDVLELGKLLLLHIFKVVNMASTTTPGIPPVTLDTITQQIGNTPLVRLNRLPRSLGIDATVYAKLEYFNAGGSVKDRIALRMIEEAERSGRIKPGDTLIEPTSGNT